ncbi:MAG: DNA polymerase III subunit psi [Psychromonas sp.]|nr:DNA polymerase III subunit psi [Psychromonas sp.]
MEHQKAVYLQEMGITRWQLRKPQLFLNCTILADISHAPMLIICSKADIRHPLMEMILCAFNFPYDEVQFFSMQAFQDHQGALPTMIWSTLGHISGLKEHQIMTTPHLAQLSKEPLQKKSLWEQFCAFKKNK